MEPTKTKEKRKAKDVLAENNTRKSLGCGRHGEKLNDSSKTMFDGNTLLSPVLQWDLKDNSKDDGNDDDGGPLILLPVYCINIR